jgi:2',3'-cyclic-nucleotide 2'-phosphodiesterase (5'-nucleotidase family)
MGTPGLLGSDRSAPLFAANTDPVAASKAAKVTLLQINDVHGYMDLHLEWFADPTSLATYRRAGGYPRIATLVKQISDETQRRVLFCDNGDTFHGTYTVVKTEGRILLPIVNQLGLAAMTAHWDFAYGPQRLLELASKLTYPILAVNIYDKKSGKRVFKPYLMKEVGGLKIGIIGIGSNIVDKTMPPEFSAGLRFTDGRSELPGYIKEVRANGVNLVVVLSHLGFPQDHRLASEISGIDVLLSGHTHNRLYQPIRQGNTLIIQSGCHGSFVGRLDLDVQDNKVVGHQHRLIEVAETIPPDPTIQKLVKDALKPYEVELGRVVGEVSTTLNRDTELEATMDNFLLDAICEAASTPLAFTNGWRWGAPVLSGPITNNDLYNIVPMAWPISTVDLTGKELIELLEQNLERTWSAEPFHQLGGYVKRCHGLTMYVKIQNPPGTRIQDLFVEGARVNPDKSYRAAFVSVEAVPENYGKNRKDLRTSLHDAMMTYLAKHKPASAELRGTVVAN